MLQIASSVYGFLNMVSQIFFPEWRQEHFKLMDSHRCVFGKAV
jgi:hypothetical protein